MSIQINQLVRVVSPFFEGVDDGTWQDSGVPTDAIGLVIEIDRGLYVDDDYILLIDFHEHGIHWVLYDPDYLDLNDIIFIDNVPEFYNKKLI